jgi:DNA modification methylase
MQQLRLPTKRDHCVKQQSYQHKLIDLLSEDLDFHDQDGRLAPHNFHSFPAKFPPQLPRKFITNLTDVGEVVLDPMLGSGTTIVEAFLTGREGVGFDIDPLALRIAQVKVTPLEVPHVLRLTNTILSQAQKAVQEHSDLLRATLKRRWDDETRDFINYWFAQETQIALLALLEEIVKIEEQSIRAFFELALSAIIITKSGGVSLALDLAHTRPHRAKLVFNRDGKVILGDPTVTDSSTRMRILAKTLRSPFDEFAKRVQQNIKSLAPRTPRCLEPSIGFGDAQCLPLPDHSVDLIVTSPPYASNAIDYMRAHKFALVWFGYTIADLGAQRGKYIGGETMKDSLLEPLPPRVAEVVAAIAEMDRKKGSVLHRYYSEMTRTLKEMFRVLKPGKAAIVVVGSSVLRNKDTETAECLAEIGRAIGFVAPKIGVRQLDRNKRMLPAGATRNFDSQIQKRMHEEYVIGLFKP